MAESIPSKNNNAKVVEPPTLSVSGFTLVECVISLVVLMVIALSIGSVLTFSNSNSANARSRYAALLLAQQRMEDVRNTAFTALPAGTVTENNVVLDGGVFTVVRTITDSDIITDNTKAPGPETKLIVIEVSPRGSNLASNRVRLTTVRAVNRPGPNRTPNPKT